MGIKDTFLCQFFNFSTNVSSTLPTFSGFQIVTSHIRLKYIIFLYLCYQNDHRKFKNTKNSQKQYIQNQISETVYRNIVYVNMPNFLNF